LFELVIFLFVINFYYATHCYGSIMLSPCVCVSESD